MGTDTRIEWATHTWNPWMGCANVSPACDHCYAEATGKRFGVAWGPQAPRRRSAHDSTWILPGRWNRQAIKSLTRPSVFACSMADFWDNAVPIEWLADALDEIRQATALRWLILTKRPQLISIRLRQAIPAAHAKQNAALADWIEGWIEHGFAPPHVWLGATTENQAEAERRIPRLLKAPAAGYFISAEPLLGPLDLTSIPLPEYGNTASMNVLAGRMWFADGTRATTKQRIGWVIAGGESGHHARPSNPHWFRHLRAQCAAAEVPFFFKQWGEWSPEQGQPDVVPKRHIFDDSSHVVRLGKQAAGAALDGREHRAVPA